jgi:hypothetical protein
MTTKVTRDLEPGQREELLSTLGSRFEENMHRHQRLEWAKVRERLEERPDRLWSLNEMERTGGEPDVTGQDADSGEYVFVDCSAQSPKGRRSVCYDLEALEARKKHKPEASAVELFYLPTGGWFYHKAAPTQEFMDLVDQARATGPGQERDELFRRMEEILREEVIPTANIMASTGTNEVLYDYVRDRHPIPAQHFQGHKFTEVWVDASSPRK